MSLPKINRAELLIRLLTEQEIPITEEVNIRTKLIRGVWEARIFDNRLGTRIGVFAFEESKDSWRKVK
jgi:hypothetical protein